MKKILLWTGFVLLVAFIVFAYSVDIPYESSSAEIELPVTVK